MRDPVKLQQAMDVLIALFERVGLRTNTTKTKAMVCVPGRIRTCQSQAVYDNRIKGMQKGGQWQHRRVKCDICGAGLAASSLKGHLESQHDIFRSFVLNRDLRGDDVPATRGAQFLIAGHKWDCPVPGCPARPTTKYGLRRHYMFRHPGESVDIPGEGVYP